MGLGCPETTYIHSSTPFHHYYASYNIISRATNSFYNILTQRAKERRGNVRRSPGRIPPSSPGGAHYPRVIVRLSDRLLRIRGYLADAVDSPYYAVTTATWPTLIWKRGFCNPERCGKMCLLMSNKSLLHLKSISHVVRKTVVDNNPSLLCRVCLTHITSQPPHKMSGSQTNMRE